METQWEEHRFFDECAAEILNSEQFKQLDDCVHHGHTTRMKHSINVAYYSYRFCLKFGIKADYKSMIRGALLHDFFFYSWYDRDNAPKLHGMTHPKIAYENASKVFELNPVEKDIITKHMWPLTIRPPRHKEAMVVCMVDTYCAVAEGLNYLYAKLMPNV